MRILRILVTLVLVPAIAWAQNPLIENGSFELGTESPQGWELSNGALGKWELLGKTGERYISIRGNGKPGDLSFWRSSTSLILPNRVYHLSFSMKGAAGVDGGTAVVGSNLVTRDLVVGTGWERHELIFTTPINTLGVFLRFGQYETKGKIFFDDVSIVDITPIHRTRHDLDLGEGELIHSGIYTFQSDYTSMTSNTSRNLVQHNAYFNTDRWLLPKDSEIVYRHDLPGYQQIKGTINIQANVHNGNKCIVEIGVDARNWTVVGEVKQSGTEAFSLPDDILPAENIYVRLRSTNKAEVLAYQYQSEIDDAALDLIGETHYAEVSIPFNSVAVEFETIGDLKTGNKHNEVSLLIANLQDFAVELEASLTIQKKGSETATDFGTKVIYIGFSETWRVRWPNYELIEATDYIMTVTIKDIFNGDTVYRAMLPFSVSSLYDANFGRLLGQTKTVGAIWWTNSANKVSRDRAVPKKEESLISLSAAKNESESFQLIITPDRFLNQLRVRSSSLISNANEIPAANVELAIVNYVLVQNPTDKSGSKGYWPDPILPYNQPAQLNPGQNYPFWITIRVPKGIAAGKYRGSISISGTMGPPPPIKAVEEQVETQQVIQTVRGVQKDSNCANFSEEMESDLELEQFIAASNLDKQNSSPKEGALWSETFEIELQVWDFELSDETHIQSAFGIDPDNIRKYHHLENQDELEKVLEKYYQNFAAHRISPINPMALHPIQTDFEGHWWKGGEIINTDKAEGLFSMRIEDNQKDQDFFAIGKKLISVDSAKTYEFGFFVKTAEKEQPYEVDILCYDKNGKILREISFGYVGRGIWQKEEIRIGSLPQGTKSITIRLSPVQLTSSGVETGIAWFDRLSLYEASHSMNLIPDPNFERLIADWNITLDTAGFESAARNYIDGLRFNAFQILLEGSGNSNSYERTVGVIEGYESGSSEYETLFSGYLTKLENYLKQNGWLDKAYVFWFDEPEQKDYGFIQTKMDQIGSSAPKLTRMLTHDVVPELAGSVDIWCPLTPNFDKVLAQERKGAGDKVWWSIRNAPKSPYAGLFIDHHGIEMRMWLWQAWKYGLDGIYIWNTNYWMSPLLHSDNELPNPYLDPMSYQSGYGLPIDYVGYWGNGDGRFLYPPIEVFDGSKSIEGPVNSIRWEMLREGIEDYEYFWILKDQIEKLKAEDPENQLLREVEGYLMIPTSIVSNMTDFTDNPELLSTHRADVAQSIEKLIYR